jgi:tRNA(Ile)-lysidine synthase
MSPVENFSHFIAKNDIFTLQDRILVAVSGGRDSVLLAHFLKQAGYQFGIAHCNFQLRGAESAAEQTFTRSLAHQLNVPFFTNDFDTQAYADEKHLSIQMAARQLRYEWFEQLRQNNAYNYIATAHHQNDAIETILLNLVRGTGIAGMHGIMPKNGKIVRPLLFLNRAEVDEIVASEGLQFVEDSSNASVKYARNKLRHQVVPVLKELNPKLENTFEHNLTRFREMEELLIRTTAELEKELITKDADGIRLSINAVKKLRPQRLLLYNLLKTYGFSETTVDDIIASLDKHSGRQFASAGFKLLLDREYLILTPHAATMQQPVYIEQHYHEVEYNHFKITLLHDDSPLIVSNNPLATSVDAAKLVWPLTVRPWQEGDVFFPLGMKGSKKISDYFINEKIPLNQKADIPVLVNGNQDVIWIAGYRLDGRYKVNPSTKKVVIFEMYKLNQ